MSVSSYSMEAFLEKLEGLSFKEIIWLTDQEATRVERHYYKTCPGRNCVEMSNYAESLKDFILYIRHGIRPRTMRELNLEKIPFRHRGSGARFVRFD